MYQLPKKLLLKTLTPLHAGSGKDSYIVDMPIEREESTGIPKIQASTLKGVLRDKIKNNTDYLFGVEKSGGRLGFTDARLLFFPIKSLKDVYAYITCPYIINRMIEESIMYEDANTNLLFDIFNEIKDSYIPSGKCRVHKNCRVSSEKDEGVYIGNYYIKKVKKVEKDLKSEAEKSELGEIIRRLVVLSDEDFMYLLSTNTEIITRNRIDEDTGTAENKGLFTEEYLPSNTYLYSWIFSFGADKEDNKKFEEFKEEIGNIKYFQLGGNTSLGKGNIKICKLNGEDSYE